MTNDAGHAIIHQLLSDGYRRFGIGRIVLGVEHERNVLPTYPNLSAVQIFDRQPHTVFVILSDVGQLAGERGNLPDLYRQIRVSRERLQDKRQSRETYQWPG
ncbi:hypothetical protein HDG40_007635 [Paraburkholderia sp. JPY158]|uniref:Uncharacterized protein n=2 Tax=Paraburkholderia TaxID=1822464 RepID=A0A7W8P5R3_9BURK|nr:hypothetical protein [Paraburkholderia youngii]MBB5421507.1 hypothetical protein [Paraburkholderia atlantica]MBB5429438.1 hypothetical protein [Paraburkholderia atlantica]